MKRFLIILSVLPLLLLSACSDPLTTPVSFSASIAPNDSVTQDTAGIYRAPVGTTVDFLFDGNADYISLSYSIFNETSATFSFDNKLSWQDNNNDLRLLISTDFPGLSKTDAQADAELLSTHDWIDLSDSVNWPLKRNDQTSTSFDLSAYRGQTVTLAYVYKTSSNAGFQPMFTLSNILLQNTVNKTGEVASTLSGQNMKFQPFDMLNLTPDSMAYQTSTAAGVWDVTYSDANDKTAIKIRQTAAGKPLNEDWLVSKNFTIPRGKEEGSTGISVKNIYLNVSDYEFTFDEYGEYTISFYAANANYKHQSDTTQVFHFVIYE